MVDIERMPSDNKDYHIWHVVRLFDVFNNLTISRVATILLI